MKIKRQAKIMEIISAMDIETQEQLLDELQKSGFYKHPGDDLPGYQGAAHCEGADVHGHLSLCHVEQARSAGRFPPGSIRSSASA